MLIELIPLLMFAAICVFLMFGYPVALTLGGVALIFAAAGIAGGVFDPNLLKSFPTRLYGIMNN
ncbi:MAG TPA: C4-dicarboxylate ABC transporter, partial [Cellvibrio sp.]|nr:C4-dicarboxylate ABC transporter [Cellvibrio sp.]